MNIIAQVCWYDEPVESLTKLIKSMAGFVDCAVFLDGCYARFPHTNPVSDPNQYEVIVRQCYANDILPIVPPGRLYDTQAEKRSRMFAITELAADLYTDYTLIIDADERLEQFDHDAVREKLHRIKPDVGLVALNTPAPDKPKSTYQRQRGIHMPFNSTEVHGVGVPRLFRMLEGVTIGPKHHGTYVGRREDGELVCLKDRNKEFAYLGSKPKVIDLKNSITITNDTWSRDAARIAAKHTYGKMRTRHREDL